MSSVDVSRERARRAAERMFNRLRGVRLQRAFQQRALLLAVLVVLLSAAMAYFYPVSFPTADNIKAVLLNASVSAILVCGMMVLMIGGVFDLSIGSVLSLCGVVAAVLIQNSHLSTDLAVLVALGCGAVAGLVNGLLVARIGINALIVTLATMLIFRGISQLIGGNGVVAPVGDDFASLGQSAFLGVQAPIWAAAVVVGVFAWMVTRTRLFRQFYFVGGNERAAELSGIRAKRVLLLGFVLMGVLAGLAGVLNAARLNAASVTAGTGIELQIITAAVLGGASLKGGEGSVLGGVLGVLFIALINNALIIGNVDVFWQNVVVGLVLITAVSLGRSDGASFKRLSRDRRDETSKGDRELIAASQEER